MSTRVDRNSAGVDGNVSVDEDADADDLMALTS